MNQEKELERHNRKLEEIRQAKTKEEVPVANMSAVTRYLTQNSSFDGVRISQSEFAPVLDAILKYNHFAVPEVKEAFIEVLRRNYPDKTLQELEQKYEQIARTSNISNYIIEANERSAKLQELRERDEMNEHNKTLQQIEDAFELEDLPKVGIGTLNNKVLRATKNDFIDRFSIEQIREISEMLLSGKSQEEIQEKIYSICETYGFDKEQTDLMCKQIESQLFLDKTIGYTIEELKAKEERVLQIYKMNHEETMEKIKEAKRISEMPPNLTESVLTGYLSGNTTIYTGGCKISTIDLKEVTTLLLEGKNFTSEEVAATLKKVAEKYYPDNAEEAYNLLKEKLEKLPRTQYLVEEINASNKKQEELIGRQCSNVNVYFVPNPKSPREGGMFYNCYINRVGNLNLSELLPSTDILDLDALVPAEMDIDSLEWYIQERYDPTFKTAGGIILNRDETIGNVNVFRPSGGSVGITPEEDEQRKQLQELSQNVKDLIANKRANADKFNEMQRMYMEYQAETDRQLEELEAKIDSLMEKDKTDNEQQNNKTNDNNNEVEL